MLKSRNIICVAGMPGCGKEEFLKVAEEKGLGIIRMGDVVREEVKKRGLELADANVGGLAHEERIRHGYGIWALRTLPHVTSNLAVIDGIRSREELEIFKKNLAANLAVVAIHASPKTRYQRIVSRKRHDDIMSWEEFRRRDERELTWGLGSVIALADYVLVNEDSVEDFRNRAKDLLARILG